ncbi:hypothetical protein FACS1894200_13960 [Spirochaetia bacterium]|nr:hypothetical protein FACS1894200_13960 [Spirochaetia bacterium]
MDLCISISFYLPITGIVTLTNMNYLDFENRTEASRCFSLDGLTHRSFPATLKL